MISYFKRWFGKKAPVLQTKMNKADVLAIARKAANPYSNVDQMYVADVADRDGKLVWFVDTAVRGSSVEVFIDDLSGEVLQVKRLPSR